MFVYAKSSCGPLLVLLLFSTIGVAQSPSSGQSTWGTVHQPEISDVSPRPSLRMAQNAPSYGEPTPATPPQSEPSRLTLPLNSAVDNFDSEPGILMGPSTNGADEPRYDSNLSVGPGGYAPVPEGQSQNSIGNSLPFSLDSQSMGDYAVGPDGAIILDETGSWPGTSSACSPTFIQGGDDYEHLPRLQRFWHYNFPVIHHVVHQSCHGLLARHHAKKAQPKCRPQITTGHWFYGGFEYLHWWTRGMTVPTISTTSPDGTPINDAGILGLPTTTSLFGPGRLDPQDNAGGRFQFGAYLDPCHCTSVQAEYFLLDGSNFRHFVRSPQDQAIIGRPYFNTVTGLEDVDIVGYPGVSDGNLTADGTTSLQGGGVFVRRNLYCGNGLILGYGALESRLDNGCGWLNCQFNRLPSMGMPPIRVDGLLGWRAYDLDEALNITDRRTTTDPAGPDPQGTTTEIVDRFATSNLFNGAVLGTDADWFHGNWGVTSRLRVSLGQMQRRAQISGSRTVTTPGVGTVSYDAGLQALASNIGSYSDDQFVAVPEVGFDWYYLLRHNLRFKAGYTFMYLPDVWRPGTIMDRSLDPRLIPPPTAATAANPVLIPSSDDFWAQGINLGVEWRY